MSIHDYQFAAFLFFMAASVASLFWRRVILSKFCVIAGLTVIAGLQLSITPLQQSINNLERQLAVTDPDNPAVPSLKTKLAAKKDLLGSLKKKGSAKAWLPWRLGLDLAGGTELRLRLSPDQSKLKPLEDKKKSLQVELTTATNVEAKAKLEKSLTEIEARIERLTGNSLTETKRAIDIIRDRLNKSGLAEIPVTSQGVGKNLKVLVQLPGMDTTAAERILNIIRRQGRLEFRLVVPKSESAFVQMVRTSNLPHNRDTLNLCKQHVKEGVIRSLKPSEIDYDDDGTLICRKHYGVRLYDWLQMPGKRKADGTRGKGRFELVSQYAHVTGKHIISASAVPAVPQFKVRFTFDNEGANQFLRLTKMHIGDQLAVVLDGKLQSAPTINGAIHKNGEITGDFTAEEAENLATILGSGALQVKITKEFENQVGPTLGETSVRQGLNSMLIGVAFVFVGMLVYYLMAGAVANFALVLNILFIGCTLAMWDATLTLTGIAGLILTVGMAVDANVLIFERIREEREKGNSLPRAIELGYERALVTILDANITTFITALILHRFGTEQVRGFATTLMIGIVTSMFCALVITRWIFEALVAGKWLKDDLKMLRIFHHPKFDFVALRRTAFVFSSVTIIAGMGLFLSRGMDNLGVDFRGGTLFQVSLVKPLTQQEALVAAQKLKGDSGVAPTVQSVGVAQNGKFSDFVIRTIDNLNKDQIRTAFPNLQQIGLRIYPTVVQVKVGKPLSLADAKTRVAGLTPNSQTAVEISIAGSADATGKATVFKLRSPVFLANEQLEKAFGNSPNDPVSVRNLLGERRTDKTAFFEVALTTKTPVSPATLISLIDKHTQLIDPVAVAQGTPLPGMPVSAKVALVFAVDKTLLQKEKTAAETKKTPEPTKDAVKKTDNASAKVPEIRTKVKETLALTAAETVKLEPKKEDSKNEKEQKKIARGKRALLAILAGNKDLSLLDPSKGILKVELVKGGSFTATSFRATLQLKHAATVKEVAAYFAADSLKDLQSPQVTLLEPSKAAAPSVTPVTQLTLLCGSPLWNKELDLANTPEAQLQFVQAAFGALREAKYVDFTQPFPRFTKVGPAVATEMQVDALMAMVFALIAIFFYIWLRFQFRVSFGLGAIVALAHDVLFTLGALALVDELGIMNGQIDLVIIAALLTIVGYSLNDTIVVFDRIRENMHGGKPLEEIINNSINQTLSRTIITSATTLVVVLSLLILGGDVIRGFAFSLLIGVGVGTYSSIFIASPILISFGDLKTWQRSK